jgi:hypothetical protein
MFNHDLITSISPLIPPHVKENQRIERKERAKPNGIFQITQKLMISSDGDE